MTIKNVHTHTHETKAQAHSSGMALFRQLSFAGPKKIGAGSCLNRAHNLSTPSLFRACAPPYAPSAHKMIAYCMLSPPGLWLVSAWLACWSKQRASCCGLPFFLSASDDTSSTRPPSVTCSYSNNTSQRPLLTHPSRKDT